MSISQLSAIPLKLSRLFLKICKWVLVKMSLNCKFSGLNSKSSPNFKVKKAQETSYRSRFGCEWIVLFFMWVLLVTVGFFWVLSGSTELNKASGFQNFNVSKDQLHVFVTSFFESDQITSFKCTKLSIYERPTCDLNVVGTYKNGPKYKEQLSSDYIAFKDKCSVQDENRDLSHLTTDHADESFISPAASSSLASKYHKFKENEERCSCYSFCFMNVWWGIFLGVAIGYQLHILREKLCKSQMVDQHPLSEQQQLKLQQAAHNSLPRSTGKWRKKLLVGFMIGGILVAISLYWHFSEDDFFRRKESLANMCDERARMLQDQFNVSMNHVHALAILVSTFHHGKHPSAIDQKTFGEYTERTAFERPLTSGVAYALRVRHSEREGFEKRQGWTIKKMETEDQTLVQDCTPENLDPSPVQDEYAPVIFSQETVSHIVSIDMMSGKEDRENILRARSTRTGVLTSPFKLLKSNHLGVVLTFAVYNTYLPPDATPEQCINSTVGYLGASYDVPSLVEKLLHQLASKEDIVVNVYDTTNKSSPINMYGDTDITDTGLLHISPLDFGDPTRNHQMHCRFAQVAPPPWTAIFAALGVLTITFLLGYIFYAAIRQIAKVENDCQKMTELKHRAVAADRAKSQFLATVSHEIRTPMNGVLGMLQMLMDTNLDANQLDYAQTAHASGKDLISLINEVLDQAKIESGRLELESVPFDLRAALDNVLSLFSGKSHEKGIELAIYVSDQVPEVVVGDPGRLRQVIANLVGNSIKFTQDRGHIFVSVHIAAEARSSVDAQDPVLKLSRSSIQESNNSYNTLSGYPVVNRWKSWTNFKNLGDNKSDDVLTSETMIKLLVTVEDTGVGIPRDAQARIFMPFMQADSSTSRTYGGTGIGLSISKRLVDLMGGEIGFVSEPGTGSTFSFTANFVKGDANSLDGKLQIYHPAVSEFRGLRALVVDEKSVRAEVSRYHLHRLGISVDITSSVDSACSYLSTHSHTSGSPHISMILFDKDSLNEEKGISVNKLLKELKPNSGKNTVDPTPKTILLANSTACNELKSIGLVDNVLAKPLRLSALISCFQDTLRVGKKNQVKRGEPSDLKNLLRGKKILVVDDNMVNRRVAEGALKKYGAIVTCVDSGKAALRSLEPPHSFHACFMDLQMPEIDGFEATGQIRSLEKKYNSVNTTNEWHTPILAMTADVSQATNEECTKCGMDGYVSKPFQEEQLYSAAAPFFETRAD